MATSQCIFIPLWLITATAQWFWLIGPALQVIESRLRHMMGCDTHIEVVSRAVYSGTCSSTVVLLGPNTAKVCSWYPDKLANYKYVHLTVGHTS